MLGQDAESSFAVTRTGMIQTARTIRKELDEQFKFFAVVAEEGEGEVNTNYAC